MTHELRRWTRAELHAVLSVESIWTHVIAMVAHPSLVADAVAVVLAASGAIFALAILAAVRAVRSVRTRNVAN